MPVINATTSGPGGIQIGGDTSGNLQLQSNGTTIATISSTGVSTQVGAPAFLVTIGSNQSVSASTYTKIQFSSKIYDTANCFDNSTNYRFTPNVAGYYHFDLLVAAGNNGQTQLCTLNKNGSIYMYGTNNLPTSYGTTASISATIYLNGSTDYIEATVYISTGPVIFSAGLTNSYFCGFLARSA